MMRFPRWTLTGSRFALVFLVVHPHLIAAAQVPPVRTSVRDSAGSDVARVGEATRLPVTAALSASAFRDSAARRVYERARAARMAQDSTLRSYEVVVHSRASAWISTGNQDRERVVARRQRVSRVRWERGIGATVETEAARFVSPLAGVVEARAPTAGYLASTAAAFIPYFPGFEPLWIGGVARDEVNDRGLVNPLGIGAEAYYTFESGDSLRITPGDGTPIRLRELQVRPRISGPRVVVGSVWLDDASGHVVRAAYRLSEPIDVWVEATENADTTRGARIGTAIGRALISPVRMTIREVHLEYSLHSPGYWLPRRRLLEGTQEIAFLDVSSEQEHFFDYVSVNGPGRMASLVANLPSIVARDSMQVPDSLTGRAARAWRDSTQAAAVRSVRERADSLAKAPCDSTGRRDLSMYDERMGMVISAAAPCDLNSLVDSPSLPGSIYADSDSLFRSLQMEQLVSKSLSLAAQAPLALRRGPRLEYGTSLIRYNRIEGLSIGVGATQPLGGGYALDGELRYGLADKHLNAELGLSRTNLTRTIAAGGYDRLVAAGDWGMPLTFRASVPALLFGRDDALYYRAVGGEVLFAAETERRPRLRLFAERQSPVLAATSFSVTGDFVPNIVAASLTQLGASFGMTSSWGLDPRAIRAVAALRLEGATGDSTYARGAADLTVSRNLVKGVGGALTLAAGVSAGGLPPQRRWFLGGAQTVRGQRPDTARGGNTFWLVRGELGLTSLRVVRPSIFGDFGWAGDRRDLDRVGRPLSSVGVGVSALDGLFRLDVSRGLYPERRVRLDFTIGARW